MLLKQARSLSFIYAIRCLPIWMKILMMSGQKGSGIYQPKKCLQANSMIILKMQISIGICRRKNIFSRNGTGFAGKEFRIKGQVHTVGGFLAKSLADTESLIWESF